MITFTQDYFDLQQIADSGQVFRMTPLQEHSCCSSSDISDLYTSTNQHNPSAKTCTYQMISGHHYLEISQNGQTFTANCADDEWAFWQHYFDLDTDYSAMISSINPEDTYLSQAAHYGSGIRILNQELWEMIITFIISQQRTIPKIREAVEALSKNYGDALTTADGKTYYTFPTPHQLGKATLEQLQALKLGYRVKYIHHICADANNGVLDLEHLKAIDYTQAMAYLMSFYGIGEKVANCVCLFGLHHINAFPVDTWIQKILLKEYFKPEYHNLPKKQLFAAIIREHFSRYDGYGGVMQQYMFFFERTS